MARDFSSIFDADPADRVRPPELGDLACDFLEGFSTLFGEAEGDVWLAEQLVVVLLRVGDVGVRERRAVPQRVPAGLRRQVGPPRAFSGLFGDEQRPRRNLDRRSRCDAAFDR